MRNIKILAIAPYEGMAETIAGLANQRDNIDITVKIGDLQKGLTIARELVHENYDVILSRGGTADLIRSELDIPVVEIPLSAYDLLRSIKMAESYSGKFAIAGFKSITNSAHMLCDLLQMDADFFTFESSDCVASAMNSIKEQGYSLVVCDMVGFITAKELGLNSILIPAGKESISDALDEAVQLVTASSYVLRQRDLFQLALSCGMDDFLIFDSRCNLLFSSLTNTPGNHPVLNMVQTYLPAFMKTDGQIFEREINGCLMEISNRRITYEDTQYLLLRVHKKETLFKDADESISIYNRNDEVSDDFTTYYNSANYVGDVHLLLEKYSQTHFPVLITGEPGTGKDKAAALIYEQGPYKNAPYYMIDCGLLNERKWNTFINSENSPLNNLHVTIYLKDAGRLSKTQAEKLSAYFTQTELAKRNRLIFSITEGTENAVFMTDFLLNNLSCLKLPLPPLRERKNDIPSISTLYINQLNTVLGKQIVGFVPQAMERICNFPWPHNLDQLRRAVKEMVILTDTSYITLETAETILKQESSPSSPSRLCGDITCEIELTQTLDDMTYTIIQTVLSDEKMNKERTAKRLGISRSTLWRMLKSHDNVE